MALALVTGGSGFVGSHLVERLVESGWHVRCLLRRASSTRYLPEPVERVYGDLGGEGLADAVRGVDTVFHVAGVTKANSPEEFYRGNVEGTGNLLRAISSPVRFVLVSSLAAIGPSEDGTPLAEDAPPHPLTHYGRSKLAAEEAVRRSPLGATAVIVRPPVVYGPRDTDVLELFRTAARGWVVTIGRRPCFVSIIHARDLADALIAAAQCDGARGRAYFVANPQPVSWQEFGRTAAALAGRRARTLAVPAAAAYCVAALAEIAAHRRGKPGIVSREKIREGRCRFWVCDVARAREELGFTAAIPLRDGMAETLAWYKKAGWVKL